MKVKWLINPFERVAGWQALAAGLAVMALTALIGAHNDIHFTGVLDIRFFMKHSLAEALLNQLVNLTVISLVIWLAAKAIVRKRARSIRLIDISGTFALARTPYLLAALFGFIPPFVTGYGYMIVSALFCILIGIWMIALMYNAFTVSCDIKGTKGTIFFIGSLIVSEIASLAINYYVMKKFAVGALVSCMALTTPAPEPELTDIHQIAEKVVEGFQKQDYNSIVAYFDDTMKKGLPEQKIAEVWNSLGIYGKLLKADTKVKALKSGEHDLLIIPCTFEKAVLTLQLSFNEKGQISGMYFRQFQ
jgi:hypothetical protein